MSGNLAVTNEQRRQVFRIIAARMEPDDDGGLLHLTAREIASSGTALTVIIAIADLFAQLAQSVHPDAAQQVRAEIARLTALIEGDD